MGQNRGLFPACAQWACVVVNQQAITCCTNSLASCNCKAFYAAIQSDRPAIEPTGVAPTKALLVLEPVTHGIAAANNSTKAEACNGQELRCNLAKSATIEGLWLSAQQFAPVKPGRTDLFQAWVNSRASFAFSVMRAAGKSLAPRANSGKSARISTRCSSPRPSMVCSPGWKLSDHAPSARTISC